MKADHMAATSPTDDANKSRKSIMGRGNISRVESQLKHFRLGYNRVVQKYNERVNKFPRNIVAWIHKFKEFDYLTLGNKINLGEQETYKGKKLFDD